MIVKGEIQAIDMTGNTCIVRLPYFESSMKDIVVTTATFSIMPGCINGYREKDIVLVAFENNEIDRAVVIGKLYLGLNAESADPRGSVICSDLWVSEKASLPIFTKLTNDPSDYIIENKDSLSGYKSLQDLSNGISSLKTTGGFSQPGLSVCRDPCTNLYGTVPAGFSYSQTDNTIEILYDGIASISADNCRYYMKCMTGSTELPAADHTDADYSGALMFTNYNYGTFGYLEYHLDTQKLYIKIVS